jgi:hypothetical protein
MSVAVLLNRLDRVQQRAQGRWIARCPAHPDRSPSLSIRELDDGRVLLHCFAGCEVADVLGAMGLSLADLFGNPLGHSYEPSHSSIPARDLLVILDHEITVAVLILNDIASRRAVSEDQVKRLVQSAARVGKARDMANPAKVNRNVA